MWIVPLLSVAGRFCSGGIVKSRRQAAGSGDPAGAGEHKCQPVDQQHSTGGLPKRKRLAFSFSASASTCIGVLDTCLLCSNLVPSCEAIEGIRSTDSQADLHSSGNTKTPPGNTRIARRACMTCKSRGRHAGPAAPTGDTVACWSQGGMTSTVSTCSSQVQTFRIRSCLLDPASTTKVGVDDQISRYGFSNVSFSSARKRAAVAPSTMR
jgi:hypothetical protein